MRLHTMCLVALWWWHVAKPRRFLALSCAIQATFKTYARMWHPADSISADPDSKWGHTHSRAEEEAC